MDRNSMQKLLTHHDDDCCNNVVYAHDMFSYLKIECHNPYSNDRFDV